MDPKYRLLQGVISGLLTVNLFGMIAAWVWAVRRRASGQPLLPPAQDRRVLWGTATVLLVFVVWLVSNIAVAAIYFRFSGLKPGHALSHREQMLLVSIINGLLLIVVPPLLRLASGARLRDLGVEREGWAKNVKAGMIGFLLLAPAVYAANGLAVLVWTPSKHPLEQMVRSQPSAEMALLALISGVLLAPAAEELVFRGIIQSWLTRLFTRKPDELTEVEVAEAIERSDATHAEDPSDSPFRHYWLIPRTPLTRRSSETGAAPPGLAVILTSLVFALVHIGQWPAPVAIFFLSLGLGTVYQRTGSLLSSFAMHAMFNGFSTLVLFLAVLAGPAGVDKTPAKTKVYEPHSGSALWAAPCSPAGWQAPDRITSIQFHFSIGASLAPCYISGGCPASSAIQLP